MPSNNSNEFSSSYCEIWYWLEGFISIIVPIELTLKANGGIQVNTGGIVMSIPEARL